MSTNQTLIAYGTAGGSAINVDHARVDHGIPVKVQLTSSYATGVRLPGAPSRPSMTGTAPAGLDFPKTVVSSTVMTLLKGEADALVAAGKATYV